MYRIHNTHKRIKTINEIDRWNAKIHLRLQKEWRRTRFPELEHLNKYTASVSRGYPIVHCLAPMLQKKKHTNPPKKEVIFGNMAQYSQNLGNNACKIVTF